MKNMLAFGLFGGALVFTCLSGFSPKTGAVGPLFLKKNSPASHFSQKIRSWKPEEVPHRTMEFPSVGTVNLFGNLENPASVLLFLSGDGGWEPRMVEFSKDFAADGETLVAGIDLMDYYKKLQTGSKKCLYPAGDLENLSEFVQKNLNLPMYLKPILVGYSSGATLAYALLCQAPTGTFRGGIALGFCPEIELDRPLCQGSGNLTMVRRKKGPGFDFTDQPAPGAPITVLQGEADQDCFCQKTVDFFEKMDNAEVVRLPKVGHGFAVTKNWLPQFKAAFSKIKDYPGPRPAGSGGKQVAMAAFGPTDGALPWTVTEAAAADDSAPMVVFLSGDGGWTGFDQQICDQLAAKKLPTIGLNCQSYFWKKKTPEQAATDLAPEIEQYLRSLGRSKLILVGYSFGANVAPFIVNRLPADLRKKVASMVLLSPDPMGDFEIHVAGMLGKTIGGYDVVAEVKSLKNLPILCVSGSEEPEDLENSLRGAGQVRFQKIPGSHHYNNDAAKVAEAVFSAK